MTLRPYQRALVGGLHRAVKEGADAVLMQSPTGSGKTSTIAEGVILPSLAQGRRFVFAAHLEELLDDTAARLRSMGVPCGIVKAGRPSDPSAPVQVCSTQTLASMLARGVPLPRADRFILDEAKRGSGATKKPPSLDPSPSHARLKSDISGSACLFFDNFWKLNHGN